MLVLQDVHAIMVNNKIVEHLEQAYDDGEILRLRIDMGVLDMTIEWNNFPPKVRSSCFEHINIQAREVLWKNIPNLFFWNFAKTPNY
jgi:hypothetical protein